MVSVLFLDRDGVINVKPPEGRYVTTPEDLVLLPGVPEAVRDLRAMAPDTHIAIVTNQRGIARGLLTLETLDAIHVRLAQELAAAGTHVDRIEVCPHDIDRCDCRKPATGLFDRVLAALPDVDPLACAVVGDSASDIVAGSRLGARTFLVGPAERRDREAQRAGERGAPPDVVADSLPDLVADGSLVDWLRDHRAERGADHGRAVGSHAADTSDRWKH